MAIRTIFSMAEDCARGERLGWHEFVRDYAGIARALLEHYFPTLAPELDAHIVAVFRRAAADNASWFSGLTFANEREFLMSFRELVFAYGRIQERLPAPQVSLEQLREIVRDLPLLERELLWLFIKGYDTPRIAAIMMNAAATSEAVKRLAHERLAALIPGSTPEAFTVSARVLMESAAALNGDQCCSLKTFNNLVNGQITWREREVAEEHMTSCFYCIDRFTSFQEMIRLRKDVPPLADAQVEAILAQLGIAPANPRTIFSKLFATR